MTCCVKISSCHYDFAICCSYCTNNWKCVCWELFVITNRSICTYTSIFCCVNIDLKEIWIYFFCKSIALYDTITSNCYLLTNSNSSGISDIDTSWEQAYTLARIVVPPTEPEFGVMDTNTNLGVIVTPAYTIEWPAGFPCEKTSWDFMFLITTEEMLINTFFIKWGNVFYSISFVLIEVYMKLFLICSLLLIIYYFSRIFAYCKYWFIIEILIILKSKLGNKFF